MNLDRIKDNVEKLMAIDPKTRDSDIWLIIRYWQEVQGLNCFIPYDKLNVITSPESIRRVRQKIQEEGKYPPTRLDIIKKRQKRAKQIATWAVGK